MAIKRFGIPKSGGPPFAKAAGAEGWLYVSGQVPRDSGGEIVFGNMTTQAKVTLDNMKGVLELAGYGLEDVIRVGVWIDDPRDFAEFNKVYTQYFKAEHAPARATIQATLMADLRVEVDCIAYKKPQAAD